jgi:hypothetical protein
LYFCEEVHKQIIYAKDIDPYFNGELHAVDGMVSLIDFQDGKQPEASF